MKVNHSEAEDLIYNRFDLIYPDKFCECVYKFNDEEYILHYHIDGDVAIVDVWARDIPLTVFEWFVSDIFRRNYGINYIKIDGSYNNYQNRLEMIRNIWIELPDNSDKINDLLSHKRLYALQRTERRLLDIYGSVKVEVYNNDIPDDLVKKYFSWKKMTHGTEYGLTPEEYLVKYHVTHALELIAGQESIAVVFCCLVGRVAYLENLSFNSIVSKYSVGFLAYKKMLEYLTQSGIRRIYLGKEGLDYKNRFDSIKHEAYWGNIISDRAIENACNYLKKAGYKKIAIYGLGTVGREFLRYLDCLDVELVYAIDKSVKSFDKYKVYTVDEAIPSCDCVIITVEKRNIEIEKSLNQKKVNYVYWRGLLKGSK